MNGFTDLNMILPEKETISFSGEIDYYGARHILSDYCEVELFSKALHQIPWCHGWVPDFWNNTDVRLVTSQKLADKSQLILTSKKSIENYLKQCSYANSVSIGLPVAYLKENKQDRLADSLLIMPAHSLDYTTHNHWKFEEYANEIAEIAKYFKHVYACLHPSCFKNGYWGKELQAKGIKIIEGVDVSDKNSLYRLQKILTTFEYVTTNSFGSHIAYAAHFGAKVSVYGTYAEYKEADYANTPFYVDNPDVLQKCLDLISLKTVQKELSQFFCLPQEAKKHKDWGDYEVGLSEKKTPHYLSNLFSDITQQYILGQYQLRKESLERKIGFFASVPPLLQLYNLYLDNKIGKIS